MQTTVEPVVDSDCSESDYRLIQVRVPEELHAAAIAKAKATRTPLALVVRVMVRQWVKGELEIKIAA